MNYLKTGATTLGLILMTMPALTRATDTEKLLGRSPDDVIELFGVPQSASISATVLKFTYIDKNKERASFAFHDDVAIMVPENGFAPLQVTKPPGDKIFCGQSVRSAALRLGNIESLSTGSNSASVTYENGTEAMIALGRVFPR